MSNVVVKRSNIQSDITFTSDTRLEQLAASRDKNRAMWRTTRSTCGHEQT